ncbi:MAG: HAMP domain-containing sensor histidine kinase [Erysipelotrichaceae bacterium]|nr:HAMP domain-containing sensor histidine kinase [Erysipelotrichaceae bacterium]
MKNRFFNSLRFRSWSYFVLFALSILLLLEFFQIIFIEPFYKNTLHKGIKEYTRNISELYFKETSQEYSDQQKISDMYSLTVNNNACVIIYDANKKTTLAAYDALGEGGCAIYSNSTVNNVFIDELQNSLNGEIIKSGKFIELSNQDVMVYGKQYQINDNYYYVISNFTFQSLSILSKTIQGQFVYISLMVLALSLIISILFSNFISEPILQVKQEAKKLTYGNYDVQFDNLEINEIKELASTIQLAANEISKVDDMRKELIANVSHDLKTPLTMIKAYAEMIKDISGDDKAKRNEHLDVIISETDSLNNLVKDLLDLSKLQEGAFSITVTQFDLTSLIEEVCQHFKPLCQNDNIDLQLDCEAELIAYGDESRINEVLYNFISNALKHCGEDKKVIVKAFMVNKEKIKIEIIDHGVGISKEDLANIWERYYKIDKSYHRSKTGTGLGLAINKAILDAHKVNYGVNSNKGKGSTFYFELNRVDI